MLYEQACKRSWPCQIMVSPRNGAELPVSCAPVHPPPCGTTATPCGTTPMPTWHWGGHTCGTTPTPCGTTPSPPPGFIFGSANCCPKKSNSGKNYHLVRLDLFSKNCKMILMNASVSLMTHTWEDVCLQSLAVDQVIYVQLCHSSCLTKDTYC